MVFEVPMHGTFTRTLSFTSMGVYVRVCAFGKNEIKKSQPEINVYVRISTRHSEKY